MEKPSAIATKTMNEIYVVLGFFLLVGLQILRVVEEQRREARRAQIEDPHASRPAEQGTTSHATVESSTPSCRGILQKTP
jgi:hypothetical protein